MVNKSTLIGGIQVVYSEQISNKTFQQLPKFVFTACSNSRILPLDGQQFNWYSIPWHEIRVDYTELDALNPAMIVLW